MSRVLIVPMAAMAQTAGSLGRAITLAQALESKGHIVSLCVASDVNHDKPTSFKEYPLETPVPLGLPAFIGMHTFPIAQKLGITANKEVKSFEEVLHLTGNIDYRYLKESIEDICDAASGFKPDVIYSEFSIPAIIAAALLGIRCFATVSYPTRSSFASEPSLAHGVNRILKENDLPEVVSTLDLFSLPEKKFVPSIPELEPWEEEVVYCGAWRKPASAAASPIRDKILVYMGSGNISSLVMVRVIKEALADLPYDVFIAGKDLREMQDGNMHIAPSFDFAKLLPESRLFINHGGQNSIIDGLINRVPMLICPGKVFERKYNASGVAKLGAGLTMDTDKFEPKTIRELSYCILEDPSYASNAASLGKKLLSYSGAAEVASFL